LYPAVLTLRPDRDKSRGMVAVDDNRPLSNKKPANGGLFVA